MLSAYELFTAACLARVLAHRKLRAPLDAPASHYVLVELEDADARGARGLGRSPSSSGARVATACSPRAATEARELWALREAISESLSATGFPHKNDIALPIAALEAFCAELGALFARRYPGWEVASSATSATATCT